MALDRVLQYHNLRTLSQSPTKLGNHNASVSAVHAKMLLTNQTLRPSEQEDLISQVPSKSKRLSPSMKMELLQKNLEAIQRKKLPAEPSTRMEVAELPQVVMTAFVSAFPKPPLVPEDEVELLLSCTLDNTLNKCFIHNLLSFVIPFPNFS